MSTSDKHRAEGSAGRCTAFEAEFEEVAFRGGVPGGALLAHMSLCKSCADRWQHERSLYTVPDDMKQRVLEAATRERVGHPGTMARSRQGMWSRARALLRRLDRALLRSLDRALGGPGEPMDDRVRALLARGERDEAATLVLETLGPGVLRYLCSFMEEDAAHDTFSLFAEKLWHELPSWRGDGSLRAWTYRVATNVKYAFEWRRDSSITKAGDKWFAWKGFSLDPYREPRERLGAAFRLAASFVTRAGKGSSIKGLRQLRATVPAEDWELFVLRVDRDLEWEEVGTVLDISADAARKRFEQLKTKLAKASRRNA